VPKGAIKYVRGTVSRGGAPVRLRGPNTVQGGPETGASSGHVYGMNLGRGTRLFPNPRSMTTAKHGAVQRRGRWQGFLQPETGADG